MTSKLECPFCGKKLVQDRERSVLSIIYRCPDDKCFLKYGCAESDTWQALIQAKQDLEIAKADIEDYKKYKALWEQIRNNTILELERKLEIATKALKQIVCADKDGKPLKGVVSCWLDMDELNKCIEQIEHKENKKKGRAKNEI